MPTYDGTLAAIQSADADCKTRGGVREIRLAPYADIQSVTESGGVVTAISMKTGKAFVLWEVGGEATTATAEFTADNGYYEPTVQNAQFEGQSPATTLAIAQAIQGCRYVAIVIGVNGVRQVYGLEVVDGAMRVSLRGLKLSRHLNTYATRGGGEDDKPRDEVDLSARHDYAPLYVAETVDLAAITA